MLDAIKGLTGGGRLQKQSDDLQSLIADARAEREALTDAMVQFSSRRAEITALNESIARMDEKMVGSLRQLDLLASRVHSLEQQTTVLDAVDARIQRLADTAAHTEEAVTQLAAPDGELESQRRQLQQLSA